MENKKAMVCTDGLYYILDISSAKDNGAREIREALQESNIVNVINQIKEKIMRDAKCEAQL